MRSDTPRRILGIGVRRESLVFCVQPPQRVYAPTSSGLTVTESTARRTDVPMYIGVWHTAVKAVGHIPSTWFAHLKVCDLRFRDLSFKSSHMPMV